MADHPDKVFFDHCRDAASRPNPKSQAMSFLRGMIGITAVIRSEKERTKSADLEPIDACLISYILDQYRKVRSSLVRRMLELDGEYPALPDMFYASRIKHLAATGVIESKSGISIAFVSAKFVCLPMIRNNRRRGSLRSTIHSILPLPLCAFVSFVVKTPELLLSVPLCPL